MNYNEWSNYTAIGYLKYALKAYNQIANDNDNDLRQLTEEEMKRIIAGEKSEDTLITAVLSFLSESKSFCGTATELLDMLKKKDNTLRHSPTSLSRVLKEQLLTLEKSHNINLSFNRTNSARTISMCFRDGDSENTHGGMAEMPSPL